MSTLPRAIRGSTAWFLLMLAAGMTNGCSTANRSSPASPENAEATADDDEPMRPASGFQLLAQRETSSYTTTAVDANESRSITQTDADFETKSEASLVGTPACSMHAESTPRGITLIFGARSGSPAQVAAQVRALAKELELAKIEVEANEERTAQPSSFGTRQIAELMSSHSIVTETAKGGRLTIDARNPERVDTLRARVLWHMASFLPDSRDERGVCPIVPRVAAEQRERDIERTVLLPEQRRLP